MSAFGVVIGISAFNVVFRMSGIFVAGISFESTMLSVVVDFNVVPAVTTFSVICSAIEAVVSLLRVLIIVGDSVFMFIVVALCAVVAFKFSSVGLTVVESAITLAVVPLLNESIVVGLPVVLPLVDSVLIGEKVNAVVTFVGVGGLVTNPF